LSKLIILFKSDDILGVKVKVLFSVPFRLYLSDELIDRLGLTIPGAYLPAAAAA